MKYDPHTRTRAIIARRAHMIGFSGRRAHIIGFLGDLSKSRTVLWMRGLVCIGASAWSPLANVKFNSCVWRTSQLAKRFCHTKIGLRKPSDGTTTEEGVSRRARCGPTRENWKGLCLLGAEPLQHSNATGQPPPFTRPSSWLGLSFDKTKVAADGLYRGNFIRLERS